jgi:hypothetical protein
VRDPVLCPYKATDETLVLDILIFKCLGENRKMKDFELNSSKNSQNLICLRVW